MTTEDVILGLLDVVREGASILGEPDGVDRWTEGARYLRVAEVLAGEIPSGSLADTDTFATVVHLRTELGSCLLAVDQLTEAGVSDVVVADVLRRGAQAAEQVLAHAFAAGELVARSG